MQGKEVLIRQSIEQRLVNENTVERRKMLTTADERIGKHWHGFCQTLSDAVTNKALSRAGYIDDEDSDVPLSVASLRLVDDDQMDWELSLGGVGSRLRSGGGKVLNQVEARLAELLKKQLDDDEFHNPLEPETLVFALKKAIDVVAPETDLRRFLLLMIEPVFTECVNLQYESANDLLADSGVEGVIRARKTSSTGRPGGAANGSGSSGDLLSMMQQLIQNTGGGAGGLAGGQGGAGSGAGFGGMAPGMIAVPAALLESLNRLQSLDLSALQSATAGESGSTTNVLRELKQHESARSLPPIEAVTIDIVATLFDFIFDDALVPDSIKALVGRLQIPLLKVAMIDKTFFSNKEHPARALLNDISRASIASGGTLVIGNPVFERIKAVINRVLNEFEQDQAIFESLLPEMKALVAEQVARANQVAEQSKKVAEEQEQHELAEVRAGEAFSRILEQGISDQVPSHIGDFLSRRYPLVLKRALLNGGVQGPAWTLTTQTLSDLLWTLLPKPTPEDRQRMISLLPDLLRRVHAFFDKVGVNADEKSAFIDALAGHHSVIIKGVRKPVEKKKDESIKGPDKAASPTEEKKPGFVPPVSEIVSSDAMAPLVVVTRVIQESGIEVESMTVAGKTSNSRTVRSIEVSGLQRGDWVEFDHDDGSLLRARLSWVSPYRGVMLFTNPESSKAVSINQEALAIKIKAGQARVLGDDTMVDRALGRAIESLKAA